MAIDADRQHGLEVTRRRLQVWLAGQNPSWQEVTITDLSTPKTGYSGEILLFDAHWLEAGDERHEGFVARLRPAAQSIFPEVDLTLHYRVLRALEHTDVLAPKPRSYQGQEGSPFGEPFFLMSRLPGRVPPEHPPYTARGWLAQATSEEQREVYCNAIDQLIRVHRADWRAMDLGFLPSMAGGQPGMDTEISLFEPYLRWVLEGRSMPLLEKALSWLKAHDPRSDALCLSWGDAKLSNILYDGTTPTGLLDWELATVAPPEVDLAFWLVFHESITRANGHPELPGFPSDEDVVARYERLTGRPVEALGYYRVWQLLRLAVISTRITDVLLARGAIRPDAERLPNATPMRLLREELAS